MALPPLIAPGVGLRPKPGVGAKARRIVVAGIVLWVFAVGFGLRALLLYSNTAGTPASPPAQWPKASPIRLARSRNSVLLFAHPQCPCSRATIGELAKILACCQADVEATVFFYRPRTAPRDWAQSDLWRSAAAIPGVRVVDDPDAAAARLFGARVSGQVLLYDAGGRLEFDGGITAFRGHSGDNDGRDAVAAIASNRIPRHRQTPVFGCALYSQE